MCYVNSVNVINKNLFRQKFNITVESSSGFINFLFFKSSMILYFLLNNLSSYYFAKNLEKLVSMQSHMCINQKLRKSNDFKIWICDNLSDVKFNDLSQNYNFINFNANGIFSMKMPHVHNHILLYSTNQSPSVGINMLTMYWENFYCINSKSKYTKYIYNVALNNYVRNSFFCQDNDVLKGSWESDYIKTGLLSENCFFQSSVDNEIFKIGLNVNIKNAEITEKYFIQDLSTQMLPEKLSITGTEHINVSHSDIKLEEINSLKTEDIEMEHDSEDTNFNKDSKAECKIIYEDLSLKIVYEKLSHNLNSDENIEEKGEIVNGNIEIDKDFEMKYNKNKMMDEEHSSVVVVGRKRNRSQTPENKRNVKPKLEADNKRFEIDFVSEDPKENLDNFDPRWEKLRLLSKDPENFKFVRGRWGNLTPPNPFVDLTYRHKGSIGNVGMIVEWERPKIKVSKSRKKKGRSLSCVAYFERIINEMNNKCNNELKTLKNRFEAELLRIDMQQNMKKLELLRALIFQNEKVYNIIQSTLYGQEKERQKTVQQYYEIQKQITQKRDSYIFFYKKYMAEVRAFCTSSSNTEHDDKLSDEQILQWDETEHYGEVKGTCFDVESKHGDGTVVYTERSIRKISDSFLPFLNYIRPRIIFTGLMNTFKQCLKFNFIIFY